MATSAGVTADSAKTKDSSDLEDDPRRMTNPFVGRLGAALVLRELSIGFEVLPIAQCRSSQLGKSGKTSRLGSIKKPSGFGLKSGLTGESISD